MPDRPHDTGRPVAAPTGAVYYYVAMPDRPHDTGRHLLGILEFGMPEAPYQVVFDHADCLYVRIADRRPDKSESEPLYLEQGPSSSTSSHSLALILAPPGRTTRPHRRPTRCTSSGVSPGRARTRTTSCTPCGGTSPCRPGAPRRSR